MPRKNNIRFEYQSEAGDYIGQGKSDKFTAADTSFSLWTYGKDSVDFGINRGNDRWNLEFAAPKGQRLQARTYENATRRAFHKDDEAGLSMYGNGRASNHSFGSFRVKAIRWSKQGQLVHFHAFFIQRSERTNAPTLRGQIYYYMAPVK